jgi:hypothetical protein
MTLEADLVFLFSVPGIIRGHQFRKTGKLIPIKATGIMGFYPPNALKNSGTIGLMIDLVAVCIAMRGTVSGVSNRGSAVYAAYGMRVVAVHTLCMTVVYAKTICATLINGMSVLIVMGGMAVGSIEHSLYVFTSGTVSIMARLTAHLIRRAVPCHGIPRNEHLRNQPGCIRISVRVMAVIAVARIINGRPWRRG